MAKSKEKGDEEKGVSEKRRERKEGRMKRERSGKEERRDVTAGSQKQGGMTGRDRREEDKESSNKRNK